MNHHFECMFNSLQDPTVSLSMSGDEGIFTIFYFVEVPDDLSVHQGRVLIASCGEEVSTSEGFPVSLLEWEFKLRSYILYFMELTSPNTSIAVGLRKKAQTTNPDWQ